MNFVKMIVHVAHFMKPKVKQMALPFALITYGGGMVALSVGWGIGLAIYRLRV